MSKAYNPSKGERIGEIVAGVCVVSSFFLPLFLASLLG